jgi:hypothetical protein
MVGASRSAVQDLCASVFSIPLRKGAIQKMVERVSEAIAPHYKQRSAKKLMQHRADGGYDRRQIHPRVGGDDHGIPLA